MRLTGIMAVVGSLVLAALGFAQREKPREWLRPLGSLVRVELRQFDGDLLEVLTGDLVQFAEINSFASRDVITSFETRVTQGADALERVADVVTRRPIRDDPSEETPHGKPVPFSGEVSGFIAAKKAGKGTIEVTVVRGLQSKTKVTRTFTVVVTEGRYTRRGLVWHKL